MKDEQILLNGYKDVEVKDIKKINYIMCPIHGKTKSTFKKNECDKCYRHRKYLEYRGKFKNMKVCLFHGLQDFGRDDKCPVCKEYAKYK